MEYIHRVISLIYYFLNVRIYKYLDFRAVVLFSVRVNGKKYISVGSNSVVQKDGWLLALKIDDNDPSIVIGEHCAIGDFSHIAAVRSVNIEDKVLIANKVYISDNVHAYEDVSIPVIDQKVLFKSTVTIKSGAWIGENVCIIGANIGKNAVVGANSVVTKDVPDYCIAVGAPAKVIKRYDFEKMKWVNQDSKIS
ncbi:Hexapeptide repeat of succinyl-transferase [Pedobacter steynii]|uniref:Hexapeptide repeat of succinyl-transferase n=1 Tax=Pedobacter steynii TaxID=430522 RepID=A0A1G9WHB5_9SPHI|nr:acyltransferase [Pedobacter steynii]NQX40297.1 acyltransferase [Pedobacter steynii]SDM83870.1 Hexapeptide repeat of succinyl-transferase [Pedobacter steynii]